jgi:hypothetical protein
MIRKRYGATVADGRARNGEAMLWRKEVSDAVSAAVWTIGYDVAAQLPNRPFSSLRAASPLWPPSPSPSPPP